MTSAGDGTLEILPLQDQRQIHEVARLFDAYRVFYGQKSDFEASERFLLERWIARESVVFAAWNGVRALGFVQLYPIFVSDRMLRFWLLNDLYVSDDGRRDGIGRALMRRAEQHALDTKSAGLTLSTATSNRIGQALYASEGYRLDDEFLYYNKFFGIDP